MFIFILYTRRYVRLDVFDTPRKACGLWSVDIPFQHPSRNRPKHLSASAAHMSAGEQHSRVPRNKHIPPQSETPLVELLNNRNGGLQNKLQAFTSASSLATNSLVRVRRVPPQILSPPRLGGHVSLPVAPFSPIYPTHPFAYVHDSRVWSFW